MIACVADHSGVEWASMLVTDDVDIEFYFLTRCKWTIIDSFFLNLCVYIYMDVDSRQQYFVYF